MLIEIDRGMRPPRRTGKKKTNILHLNSGDLDSCFVPQLQFLTPFHCSFALCSLDCCSILELVSLAQTLSMASRTWFFFDHSRTWFDQIA